MPQCLICSGKFSCPNCKPGDKFEPANGEVGKVAEPCPLKCTATILVRDSQSKKGIDGIGVKLSGSPKTDANGFAHFADLAPGEHIASVSLAGFEARYDLPKPGDDKITKTIDAGGYGFYVFELDPLTSLEVTVARSDRDGLGIKGAAVRLTEGNGNQVLKTSSTDDGKVLFTKLRSAKVELQMVLKAEAKDRFHVDESFTDQTRSAADKGEREVSLDLSQAKNESKFVVTPRIYLSLHYTDAEGAVFAFPKDFAVDVVFSPSDAVKAVQVLDDKGNLRFDAAKDQTHFTLKFDSTKLRLLSRDKDAQPEDPTKLIQDATEPQLRKLCTDGAQFFALPTKWSLVHAVWETTPASVIPVNGKVVIPIEGVGTEALPHKLVLKPKLQYVRFLFHDRKYGRTDHAKAKVSIPAVPVRASRLCDDTTAAPVDPIAGTHDTLANWMVDRGTADASQVIPWVVTKKDDGTDLPKLTSKMLIEFGWEDGFVVSNGAGAGDRVVESIPSADPRRLPTKDRHKFYDLPTRWLSKCYYTRLDGGDADPSKNRFFDKLTDTEIETSYTKGTPLRFSLDDVVLVSSAGDQLIKDIKRDGVDLAALTKHSRLALLYLDAADEHKVKVHDPRPQAPYFSTTLFTKDPDDRFRNVLVSYPHNLRVVVFCNNFHDVYDKRTSTADFGALQVIGARAALIDDADVSVKKVPDQAEDVTKGYVHRTRNVDLHYLHYAESDGTKVYAAMVTFWSTWVFSQHVLRPPVPIFPAPKPAVAASPGVKRKDAEFTLSNNVVDARNFRERGLANAMVRWNEKDYQFEVKVGTDDVIVKTFCLFEAKEVEEPVGTFNPGGGVPHCLMGVGPDQSSATDTYMYMRTPTYNVEADWRSDVRKVDIHGVTHDRLVIAHEIGHAAIGLWDDYITQKWEAMPAYATGTPQRYLGVPYKRDDQSMMSVNRSPRLRMYWGRANWLNDESGPGGTLNKFNAARRFKITWVPPARAKLNYWLDEPWRNLYKPAHQAASHHLGHQGAVALYLYKLGEDEFAHQTKGGPYTSMLVIELRISAGFTRGLTPDVDAWAAGQAYVKGKCVEHDAVFYACLEDHTSIDRADSTNKPPHRHWAKVDTSAAPANGGPAWTSGQVLAVNAWRKSGGANYFSIVAHTCGSRVPAFFQAIAPPADWVAKTKYALGIKVVSGGRFYECTRAHKSGKAFAGAFWSDMGAHHGAYADGIAFSKGDICTHGGGSQVCAVAHTSGSLDADLLAHRIAKCDNTPSEWTMAPADDRTTWISNLNTDILARAEDGGTGKFKITAPGGDFSATYVRMFAQWHRKTNPTIANPADTQFSINVIKGGGSTCFAATGTALTVGSQTDTNTIIRYLFGLISDDATKRAAQDRTADLAVGDLTPIVQWMKDRVPGSNFTAQLIP